jgi:drug/metabolite transporter (DMT)-like permease|tara:strand:+ start:293 stop:721 length:429 start_codon:yes stop_codon:yes gene_type:complete
MEKWIISILVGVLFFVSGQVYLRKSFDTDSNYFTTAIIFSLAIGATSLVLLFLSQLHSPELLIYNNSKLINAAMAGLLFFIGNLFWIYSISTKKSLGNIRVIMAGFETFMLFLVGYFYFNEIINSKQLMGALLILFGIYFIQ